MADDPPDCEFCRIAAGDADAHRVYEDEATVAFLDANPAVEGHVLVVPKRHLEGVLTTGVGEAVFATVGTVAEALQADLGADGFSTIHTTGPLIGTTDHAHVHLLPRWDDDDISLALPRKTLAHDRAERLAERLRQITA
jgi:histidine triad (HIT) family protein